MIIRAHQVAKEAIPGDFILGYDQIYWSHWDNRPLLRVFQAQGVELMKMGEYGKAIKEFDFLLRVNPRDNQGARFNMLECFQRLGRPEDVIALEHEYERDHSVEFYYGKLLALLQLGRLQEAAIQLATAKASFPYVAEELVKTEHMFPSDEFVQSYILEGVYPLGSKQEAYDYWCKTKGLWEKDQKINKFLTKNTAA
jgi:tetratricopeptide (TPR) repeat protein